VHYRARDLLLLPGLLSLARLPLGACFALSVGQPYVALIVLALAGLTDMLDGWYARRHGEITETGAALDPVTDKLFVLTVAVTLVVTRRLSVADILLLSTREMTELPLVLWFAFGKGAARLRSEQPAANEAGKLATCCQFAAVASALFHGSLTRTLVAIAAGAGLVAGFTYWRRMISAARKPRAPFDDHQRQHQQRQIEL
jgi:CDP-diacylglycerol--glycerol-3-phosphate 3-phosphatidyltransferase/cardiolipin synthase